MKNTLLQLLPAVVVVALYVLLAGGDQVSSLRREQARLKELGSVEDHDMQVLQLQAEKNRVQAELDALRANPSAVQPRRRADTDSAALREAHRRLRGQAGARILGVFRSDEASAGSGDSSALDGLLRDFGGGSVRRWSVSLEAPWPAMRAILDDFSSSTNGTPILVRSLSMQPGVGSGKPTCWSMTICQ